MRETSPSRHGQLRWVRRLQAEHYARVMPLLTYLIALGRYSVMRPAKLLFGVVLCTVGCGWERKVLVQSLRDSSEKIEFSQPWPANGWGLRVRLLAKDGDQVLYSIRGDVFLRFAAGYWSPDGRLVGVFTCGDPRVRLAYDRVAKQPRTFDLVRAGIAETIRSDYAAYIRTTEKSVDPLEWACSNEGDQAFHERFPRANPG